MKIHTTHTTTSNGDMSGNEQREESFDAYYKKVINMQDRLERINVVAQTLEKKYQDYRETREFVYFLRNVEEIFAHAAEEKWSVERTEDEMIKSEIYLLSKMSGIEEGVFLSIYEEFTRVSHDVEKIQIVAKELMDRYPGDESPNRECREFIAYARDALLVFAHTLQGDREFDEVTEAKMQIIRVRMESMASDDVPPLQLLQQIYDEFMQEIRK